MFKLENVLDKGALSIHKILLRSRINKRNTEVQHIFKKVNSNTF